MEEQNNFDTPNELVDNGQPKETKIRPITVQKRPMTFGKVMLASLLGTLIVSVAGGFLWLIVTVGLIAGLSNIDNESATTVQSGTFLTLDLSEALPERTPDKLSQLFGEQQSMGFVDLLRAIEKAGDDPKVAGILLKASTGLSWGQSEELRDALQDFKEKGKPIVAYATVLTQNGYYLASVADQINFHPEGMIDFRGIGGEVMFYKDLLDKLDVEMQLIRPTSCAYKSAGEVYTLNHMSDANREQIHTYINSIWQHVCQNMADSRHISVDSLNAIADNLTGCLAHDALKSGLVDSLCFESEVRQLLKDKYEATHTLAMSAYVSNMDLERNESHDNKIAVIYAEGNVVEGSQNGFETNVYGDDIVKAFDKAAEDDNVKAVVLRVNSPGGACTASESMTNAILRCKAKKPVVVSMSDLAASAGYEISCYANKIVAEPTTITGSIGVFATIPNMGGLLRNKIGLAVDTVQTNKNSTGLSMYRPLSPTAMAMMQRNVENFYVTFVSRVAEGRHMKYEEVDSIARGRVWTGADALRLGLVDTLGSLQTAINIAAELGKTNKYDVVDYPAQEDIWTMLSKLSGSNDDDTRKLNIVQRIRLAWAVKLGRLSLPAPLDPLAKELYQFSEMEGMQSRLEFFMIEPSILATR